MPISQRALTLIVVVLVILVGYFFWATIIEPDSLKDSKHVLHVAKTIPIPNGHGPEGLEFDPQGGGPYVGVTDGCVLKWSSEELGWVVSPTLLITDNCSRDEVVPSCGRPLGLTFNRKTGDLYICDGYFGLMKVGPEGGLAELLLGDVEGRNVTLANQGDIDEEDDIFYFNDNSDIYHFGEVFYVSISGERVGRVTKRQNKNKNHLVV